MLEAIAMAHEYSSDTADSSEEEQVYLSDFEGLGLEFKREKTEEECAVCTE